MCTSQETMLFRENEYNRFHFNPYMPLFDEGSEEEDNDEVKSGSAWKKRSHVDDPEWLSQDPARCCIYRILVRAFQDDEVPDVIRSPVDDKPGSAEGGGDWL